MYARNAILSLLLLSTSAGATQFQAFDRAVQVRGSDVIVLGRVLSTRSDWDESGRGIHTDVEIAIDEVWKGLPSGDEIVVRTPGGVVDDVEYALDGSASFREGESVLVFLNDDHGIYRPFGMTFGKYAIEGGRDAAFLVGSLPPAVAGAQTFEVVSVTLDDLRREIDEILEGAK